MEAPKDLDGAYRLVWDRHGVATYRWIWPPDEPDESVYRWVQLHFLTNGKVLVVRLTEEPPRLVGHISLRYYSFLAKICWSERLVENLAEAIEWLNQDAPHVGRAAAQ